MPITDRLLLGPGPSNPYPEAVAALGRPLLGHMDPEFLGDHGRDDGAAAHRLPHREPAHLPGERHRLGGDGGVLRQPARGGRHRDRRRQRRVRRPHVRGGAPLRCRRRAHRGGVGPPARSAAAARRAARAPARAPRRRRARRDVDRGRERHRAARARCATPTRCCSSTPSRRSGASRSRSTAGASTPATRARRSASACRPASRR